MIDISELLSYFDSDSHEIIGEVLAVDAKFYETIPISRTKFSVRAENVLKANSIENYGQLINKSFNELKRFEKLGDITGKEILKKCYEIVSSHSPALSKYQNELHDLLNDIRTIIDNCQSDSSLLDIYESLIIALPVDSERREAYAKRLDSLYLLHRESIKKLKNIMISDSLLEKKALPFIQAYSFIDKSIFMKDKISSSMTLSQIKNLPEFNDIDKTSLWLRFFEWVNKNINDLVKNSIKNANDERSDFVLCEISHGSTLREVAQKLGNISHERVRQILEREINRIRHGSLILNNPIPLLFGHFDGKKVIFIDDLHSLIDDQTLTVFSYCLKQGIFLEEGKWHYSDKFKAIIFDFVDNNSLDNVENAICSWPEEISYEQKNDYLLALEEEYQCGYDYLLKVFSKYYNEYNNYYSRKKLTFTDMCSHILKVYFVNGFHPTVETEFKKFCSYLESDFNYDCSQLNSNYLYNTITTVGMLCDLGCYKHPDYFDVSSATKEIILNYVKSRFDEGRTALSFNEIFIGLNGVINSVEVANQFVLHSLFLRMNNPYKTTKDYLLLDENSSFENDFINYIKSNYAIRIQKVAEYFCTTEAQIRNVIARCPDVKIKGGMLQYQKW